MNNDTAQPPPAAEPNLARVMARRITALVIVSLALGLAFNAASPLGVRWTAHAEPPAGDHGMPAAPLGGASAATFGPPRPSAPAADEPQEPTPTEWATIAPLVRSGQVVMVDARTQTAYDAGHIPGAVSLPFVAGPEEFRAFRERYDPDQHLVVYCSNERCGIAQRLAYRLAGDYGFRRVQYMPGGYVEWQLTGFDDGGPGAGTGADE